MGLALWVSGYFHRRKIWATHLRRDTCLFVILRETKNLVLALVIVSVTRPPLTSSNSREGAIIEVPSLLLEEVRGGRGATFLKKWQLACIMALVFASQRFAVSEE